MQQKEKKLYLNNATLLEELRKSHEIGEMTPKLVELFQLMIDRISSKLFYKRKEDREDCLASAMADCCQYWTYFDETKSEHPNPFAYFTSIICNGLGKGWRILGKSKFPDSVMVSLDSNIHSL